MKCTEIVSLGFLTRLHAQDVDMYHSGAWSDLISNERQTRTPRLAPPGRKKHQQTPSIRPPTVNNISHQGRQGQKRTSGHPL
ncbi:hypothetical protein IFR04_000534 [Cadophora malorum]|uniref:Uncharacterized protein n=1 Tax=Cadophora malorum TaxID=108018 RepID=A0A8H8BWA6_9HELO|nr:hypothetical protein IFR04_000534 [Cadophora malorum]